MAANTQIQITKSPTDNRTYTSLTLSNQIQCLIIRDQQTQMSSAALSVGIGSFQDPLSAQGLAHYLEHMLFMGTQKYPDENEYSNYITKHSGTNNAYTSQEETNFHFEISSEAFEGALDRFAQFFIAPLMDESSSARELNAVHSEHTNNLQNDHWRKFQFTKHISKLDSPYNKFSTGDKNSLANQNLSTMLKQFYEQNYSSNLMKLVIYGREEISKMETWLTDMFSSIKNQNLSRFTLPECPFGEGAFKKIFKIVPVRDNKKLQLSWILPDKRAHYRSHPGKYVTHLLGHEGKGSLFSILMKEGLATSITAGSYDSYDVFCELSMVFQLTEKGLEDLEKIVGYTFFYLDLIRQSGIQRWIFEELQTINSVKFQYLDQRKGMSETAHLAKFLHTRKIQEINSEPYLMEEFQPQTIAQFLSELTPQNLIVYCEAKQFQHQCNLEEPIYKTKYLEAPLWDIVALPCQVDLPQKNIFLPQDLTTLPMVKESLPESIFQSKNLECFYKGDHRFELPKVNISLRINFKGSHHGQEEVAKCLFLQMLEEDLKQFTYLAETAEISIFTHFVSYYGLEIKLRGFRYSVIMFIGEYLKKVINYCPKDEKLFEILREKKKNSFRDDLLDDPFRLVYEYEISSMRHGSSVPAEERLISIDAITLQDVACFSRNWKKFLYTEAYVAGNISQQSAHELAHQLNQLLATHSKPLHKGSIPDIRAVRIPCGEISIIEKELSNKSESNSAIAVQFQGAPMDVRTELLFKLCETVTREPAFDYLRTKEQLGYSVFCMHEDHRGVGSITFIIQSSIKATYQLRRYVDIFIEEKLRQVLNTISEEDFKTLQSSLRCASEQKDKNLIRQSIRYWTQVVKHQNLFNRKQIQLQTLSSITLSDLKIFMEQLFYKSPRRFEFHLTPEQWSEKNKEAKSRYLSLQKNGVYIYESAESFRKKMDLFPDFYAHK